MQILQARYVGLIHLICLIGISHQTEKGKYSDNLLYVYIAAM